jgi:hypothetical protein
MLYLHLSFKYTEFFQKSNRIPVIRVLIINLNSANFQSRVFVNDRVLPFVVSFDKEKRTYGKTAPLAICHDVLHRLKGIKDCSWLWMLSLMPFS